MARRAQLFYYRQRDLTTGSGNGRLRHYVGKPCPYCGVVMTRDGGWNRWCAPSRDHVVPKSRGGMTIVSNMIVCCRRCNEDKGSLTAEEYVAVRAGLASRLDLIINARRSREMNFHNLWRSRLKGRS